MERKLPSSTFFILKSEILRVKSDSNIVEILDKEPWAWVPSDFTKSEALSGREISEKDLGDLKPRKDA